MRSIQACSISSGADWKGCKQVADIQLGSRTTPGHPDIQSLIFDPLPLMARFFVSDLGYVWPALVCERTMVHFC